MASNRYIVLLKDQHSKSIKRVEDEFSLRVTSSELLSEKNKSFEVIDNKNAVLYKYLGVMVVADADEEQLISSLSDAANPIVYYEKERDFFPADELSLISELKSSADQLRDKIGELEAYILQKPVPEQSLVELEWGLRSIGIDRTPYTGKGVDVCVLDTGLDAEHPDFLDRAIEGKTFIEGEPWNKDPYGHGTHCAGTACGNVRNDTGRRYGIARDANLKIGKVLSNNGRGTTGSIIDAIDWAISQHFRIISLSLASPVKLNEKPSLLFETIGNRALNNNTLLIAAAGNDSNRPSLPKPVSAPANCASFMAVAAIDSQMRVARFSNGGINAATGGNIDLCAPGVDIISASPRKDGSTTLYTNKSGTSMATPHVSGVAALYMEQFPHLNAREIWALLESKAKWIEGLKYRDIGKGLVQVFD